MNSGLPYAVLLLVWYGGVAYAARLRAWFAVTVPVVALLYLASGPLAAFCQRTMHVSPAWGVALSALLLALSHGAEAFMPPRTVHPWRWTSVRDYVHAPGLNLGHRVLRALHLVVITVLGAGAEAWASLRLMPYNWLMLMMRLGYAPQRRAELQDWAERAWATGQPALDFIGTGGGTFLQPPNPASRAETFPH
jgi:hypothetical protein